MSALMALDGPVATLTFQERLAELVTLGRELQLRPSSPEPLVLPSWPAVDRASGDHRKVAKRLLLAGTTALMVTHGYQIATAIAGAPERPSFATAAPVVQRPSPPRLF